MAICQDILWKAFLIYEDGRFGFFQNWDSMQVCGWWGTFEAMSLVMQQKVTDQTASFFQRFILVHMYLTADGQFHCFTWYLSKIIGGGGDVVDCPFFLELLISYVLTFPKSLKYLWTQHFEKEGWGWNHPYLAVNLLQGLLNLP